MPNWVYNTLTIEGDQFSIARLKKQVGQPYTRKYADYKTIDGELKQIEVETTFNNPVFAFWNICKPEDMHAYLYDEDTGVPKDPTDEKAWFQSNNWYDWNVRNWGTKWDVSNSDEDSYPETELMIDEEMRLQYSFNTAWAPPTAVIKLLSEQYPTMNITLDYEEETGWGGETEFTNGSMLEISSYGWKCRECDEEQDDTPYCDGCDTDMCPECGYGEPSFPCEQHKEKLEHV